MTDVTEAIERQAAAAIARAGPIFSRPGRQGARGPQGVNSGLINLVQEGAIGGSAAQDTAAFQAAIAKAAALGCGIEVAFSGGAPFFLNANIAVPAGVPLVFAPGAQLAPQAGSTLTINGPVDAGRYRIFSGAGAVILAGLDRPADPRWFGATGDGATDDAAALASAVAAIGTRGHLGLVGQFRSSANVTFGCGVSFGIGSTVKPSAGVTLTLNGPVSAVITANLFDCSLGGTVKLGPKSVERATPQMWGALGDGVADDTLAIQRCADACFGSSAAYNGVANQAKNIPMHTHSGVYNLSGAPLLLTKLVGGRFTGAGRFATQFVQLTDNTPVIKTNGCAYTRFADFSVKSAAANAAGLFELDWDNSAGGNALQSNTFENLYHSGNGVSTGYGTRVGASGFMGSENLWVNCFWDSFSVAGVYIGNFNALQNTFLGGNIQSCTKYGIRVFAGSVHVFSMGFQNAGFSAAQVTNDGFDISIVNSADDISTFRGCRSESFRFLEAGNAHSVIADGCNYTPAVSRWTATTAVAVNALYTGTNVGGNGKLYRCTTAGVTGAAEPAWGGPTTNDGTVVWTLVDFATVSGSAIALQNCILPFGTYSAGIYNEQLTPVSVTGCTFSRIDWAVSLYEQGSAAGNSRAFLGQNFVRLGGGTNTGGAPQRWRSMTPAAVAKAAKSFYDLGVGPLFFSMGMNGQPYADVGFMRGSGHNVIAALNTLALFGTLAAEVPETANTPGNDTIISGGQGTGTGVSGKLRLRVTPPGVAGSNPNTPVDAAVLDDSVVAGDTRFLLYDVTAGAVVRVTRGAADSGGVGFRALRIPN